MPRKKSDQDEKFKAIFDHSPIAIWEEDMSALAKLRTDLDKKTVTNINKYLSEHPELVKRTFKSFKILDVNRAAVDLYGAKNKQQLVSRFGKTFSKEFFEVLVDEFTALLSGKLFYEAEFKAKTMDKKKHDVLLKVSVPEKQKNTLSNVIVTLQDITDQKKVERYLRKMAQLDSLTRMYNHSTINQRLDSEFHRAKRYGSSLSCLMIDVDHFKVINDEFGHQKGDVIIKKVADTIKDSVRKVDVVGRYGGDEFLVILPETKPSSARIAADRIQNVFTSKIFKAGNHPVKIALSIGIAGFPMKGVRDPKDLIARADKAMYAAKKTGRNKVVLT